MAAVHALTRASRLLERSLDGLSLADFRVLSAVAGGEARASRMAARLALGKPTISATVDSLCRRGLLQRTTSEADQRVLSLALTAEGEGELAVAERRLAAIVDDLAERTPDPEATTSALAALNAAIEAQRQEHLATVQAERG